MAEDKRNRGDQPPGGNEGQDRDRRRERKPGGNMETPGSGRNPNQDEQEQQE